MTLFDSTAGETGEAGDAGDAGDAGPRRLSLARLAGLIAQAAGAIGKVAVEGEVHRPQTGRTGRQWFTLRDRVSQVSVSVPSAAGHGVASSPVNGSA